MASYRSTSDIVRRALEKAGEPTNGNSSYQDSLVEYLSDIHRGIICGGTVFNIDVDEVWSWARSRSPLVINLLPAVTTGTLSLTQGALTGTFSSAPAASLQGWFFRSNPDTADNTTYRIAQHTAGGTSFILDSPYLGATSASFTYRAFKLDYELLPEYLQVTTGNNKLDFSENGSTQLTATVTPGAYTPTALAAALQTAMAGAGGANTYTVTYDTKLRLFPITSSLSNPGSVFQIFGERGTNNENSILNLVGFDIKNYTERNVYTGVYALGGISRLIEPIKLYSGDTFVEAEGLDYLNYAAHFAPRFADQGTPTCYTKIHEDNQGKITLRFNNYPEVTTRCEIEYVPVIKDLQYNEKSEPLIPVKYYPVLEQGAIYFLFQEKEDSKKEEAFLLAQKMLQAMQKQFRSELRRIGNKFGYVSPRGDGSYFGDRFRRLRYGYDKDDY